MTQRDVAPFGAPCWIDLFTSDPDKSRAFYGELFGWEAKDTGELDFDFCFSIPSQSTSYSIIDLKSN